MRTEIPISENGRRKLLAVLGERGTKKLDQLNSEFQELARLYVAYPFEEIYARPCLPLQTRELIAISALAALGTARPQLKSHIHGALHVGCSREQVKEVLLMMTVFAGFPAALNAWDATREVFEEIDHTEEGKK